MGYRSRIKRARMLENSDTIVSHLIMAFSSSITWQGDLRAPVCQQIFEMDEESGNRLELAEPGNYTSPSPETAIWPKAEAIREVRPVNSGNDPFNLDDTRS